MKTNTLIALIALLALSASNIVAAPLGTAFTYQGCLTDGTTPANGTYDLKFNLYDAVTGGTSLGENIKNPVAVSSGLFTVSLDFGSSVWGANARWLQISVRPSGSASSYTVLTPRQELQPPPNAQYAKKAEEANSLLNALADSRLTGTYSQNLNFNNAANNYYGNGANLLNLNANNISSGTLNDLRLSANIPRLNGNNSFSGQNRINDKDLYFRAGADINHALGWYGSGKLFGVLNPDGPVLFGFGGGMLGTSSDTNAALQWLGSGRVLIDPASSNDGNLTSGALLFGRWDYGTGEGIASKRTATGNQYGLDFYTASQARLSISNNGSVLIPNNTYVQGDLCISDQDLLLRSNSSAEYGIGYFGTITHHDYPIPAHYHIKVFPSGNDFESLIPNPDSGTVVYTESKGHLGTVSGGNRVLTWTSAGRVGIGTTSPGCSLHVAGDYLQVDGLGNEKAYLGGDAYGGDVQLGSANSSITAVALVNRGSGERMDLHVKTITIHGGSDVAEPFKMSSADIPKGAIVVIDENNPGHLKLSQTAYDTRVAGIVSGANGVNPGLTLSQASVLEGDQQVALSGRVYALADASIGAIQPGDLLTTSATPGHAMKVADHAKAQGAIIGKAMSSLDAGKGMVLVLVSLQ